MNEGSNDLMISCLLIFFLWVSVQPSGHLCRSLTEAENYIELTSFTSISLLGVQTMFWALHILKTKCTQKPFHMGDVEDHLAKYDMESLI